MHFQFIGPKLDLCLTSTSHVYCVVPDSYVVSPNLIILYA